MDLASKQTVSCHNTQFPPLGLAAKTRSDSRVQGVAEDTAADLLILIYRSSEDGRSCRQQGTTGSQAGRTKICVFHLFALA